jgi:hypothetical protein
LADCKKLYFWIGFANSLEEDMHVFLHAMTPYEIILLTSNQMSLDSFCCNYLVFFPEWQQLCSHQTKKQIVHSILKQGNGTCDEMSSLFKQRVTAESQHSKLHQLGWTSAQKEKQHSEHLIRLDQT